MAKDKSTNFVGYPKPTDKPTMKRGDTTGINKPFKNYEDDPSVRRPPPPEDK
jgi:hypothetical protein